MDSKFCSIETLAIRLAHDLMKEYKATSFRFDLTSRVYTYYAGETILKTHSEEAIKEFLKSTVGNSL